MAKSALTYEQRLKWFHQARFGMFIHWGLYSLLGRGEWVMFQERMRPADYAKLADRFNPRSFDPNAWARLAKDAGMKYMVLTARHHDGFCLYDSKVSDFTSTKTRAERDFVAEYVKACRKAGLKVGIYYSLLDWRYPGYFKYKTNKKSADAMREQCHEQVRELMSDYGKVDLLWYDGCWLNHDPKTADTDFWQPKKLNAMVRKLQPAIIINNRSGSKEDLDTPEQHVTASKPGRGWESCMTIADSCGWGYVKNSPNMKTVTQLLQNLVIAATGEGNLLLNVGPKPDGSIRREETVRLHAMGEWLKANGEAIYGSQRCELHGGMVGLWTRKGRTGYLNVCRWPGEELVVPLIKTNVKSAKILATGKKVKVRREYNGRLVLSGMPKTPPDKNITTIKVEFTRKPEMIKVKNPAAWLEGKA